MVIPSMKPSPFRILDRVPSPDERVGPDEILLVCPWLAGLPAEQGLWLSALPIHDANGFVDQAANFDVPAPLRARCYFGIFALDRLRSSELLLESLRRKGITRLVNLPSVSFFDGASARTLDALDFKPATEIAFLLQAKRMGFGVGLCVRVGVEIAPEDAASFDFLMSHRGPGEPIDFVRRET
jgi:predicted TIM-barrel enzyme